MSADLSIFHRPVPPEAIGLEAGDTRLAALETHAEKGDLAALLGDLAALREEGVYDVRIAALELWAAYAEGGLPVLGDVLEAIRAFAASAFAGFHPEAKRAAHASRRLAWLFKKISSALEYDEVRCTSAWQRWVEAGVAAPVDGLDAVDAALGGEEPAHHAFAELAARVRWVGTRLAEPENTARASAAPAAAPPASVPGGAHPALAPRADRVELTASARYFELVAKLAAFGTLVRRGDFRRAAVVADDLTRLLDEFDPRAYFPEVFSDFSQLLSENIDQIAVCWEERETIAWKARTQFYQVDLRRFVEDDGK